MPECVLHAPFTRLYCHAREGGHPALSRAKRRYRERKALGTRLRGYDTQNGSNSGYGFRACAKWRIPE